MFDEGTVTRAGVAKSLSPAAIVGPIIVDAAVEDVDIVVDMLPLTFCLFSKELCENVGRHPLCFYVNVPD